MKRTKNTLSKAKAKAWKAFSLWVRMKSKGYGEHVPCYTCGNLKLRKEINAGHGIGGRNNAILFEERVVRPQCVGCNLYGRGQYQIFTRKLIDELGLDTYDQIVSKARIPVKYTIADYETIEAKYKQKVAGLEGV
jgi:hypothetical protein